MPKYITTLQYLARPCQNLTSDDSCRGNLLALIIYDELNQDLTRQSLMISSKDKDGPFSWEQWQEVESNSCGTLDGIHCVTLCKTYLLHGSVD